MQLTIGINSNFFVFHARLPRLSLKERGTFVENMLGLHYLVEEVLLLVALCKRGDVCAADVVGIVIPIVIKLNGAVFSMPLNRRALKIHATFRNFNR